MFGKGKGSRDEPEPLVFPEIAVDRLAAEMRLEKRGETDARAGVPPVSAATLSAAELEAAEAVRTLRRRTLARYEESLNAFAEHVDAASVARERVEQMIAQARHDIRTLTEDEEVRLEAARGHAGALERRLRAFQHRHRLDGPPRDPQNGWFVLGLVLLLGMLQAMLGAHLFAEAGPLDLPVAAVVAAAIAVVNVSVSYALGGQVRALNRRGVGAKLWGFACLGLFVAFLAALNLAAGHLRDALEAMPLGEALIAWVERLVAGPLDLVATESWLVAALGGLAGMVAYWKGMTRLDPMPGYNALHREWTRAVDGYAEAHAAAQADLERAFTAARERLEAEAQARRQSLRAAIDAVGADGGLTRSLDDFLETCDEAANRLIRLYRDANLRVRDDEGPHYFNDVFSFPTYRAREIDAEIRATAVQEVRRIEDTLRVGLGRLRDARDTALDGYPTVRQLRAGGGGPQAVEGAEA